MERKKKGLKWLIRGIGIVILVYILSRIDLATLAKRLSSADWSYILISASLAPLFILLKAYRFQLILRNLGVEVKLVEAFHLYALGLLAGIATPGQVGELAKGVYLKGKGYPLSSSLIAVFSDRGFDIAGLLFLSIGSLILLRGPLYHHLSIFVLLFIMAIIFLIILLHPKLREQSIRKLAPLFLKRKGGLAHKNEALLESPFSSKHFLLLFGITVIAFLFAFFRYLLLARSLRIDIPVFSFLAMVILAQGVSLIPITVAGLGTREATLILLFSQFNISPELAVSLSFLILFLMLINAGIGLFSWLKLSR